MRNYTKGFKAFDKGLVCRGFQFEEGKEYFVDGEPVLCENGFHFCKDLVLTLEYYPDFDNNEYAEVEAVGDIVYEEPTQHKCCTNRIRIVRVIPREELLKMVDGNSNSGYGNSGNRNSGNSNSGYGNSGNRNSGNSNSGNSNSGYSNSGHGNSGNNNSGNRNSGNRNSGDGNSGNRNSGYGNSGDRNSGNRNSGNRNSGYGNSGNRNSGYGNSGDRNSGHGNSGDWNACDYETGAFNSEQSDYIRAFNKPCLRSYWENARKPDFLYFDIDATIGYKASLQKSFESADAEQIAMLKALPNFDADVFFEISGIRID